MGSSLSDIGLLDRYMQATGGVPLLTGEEEIMLAEKMHAGDSASRDRLILANLRLVVKIAYDYAHMGVPMLDLVSEGNVGLIKSVDRFDPKRGGRLATYAAWWIRQTIKKALADQSKTIRLPLHIVEKIAKMRRAINELSSQLDREPTPEEAAKALHISVRRLGELQTIALSAHSIAAHSASGGTLEDTITDEDASSPLASLLKKTAAVHLHEILNQMDEREAAILKLRHGLDGSNTEKTLDQIGQELGLTRERVRQLEQSGQTHLKRLLCNDERPRSSKEAAEEKQERARVEVLRQFMIEKGLLK